MYCFFLEIENEFSGSPYLNATPRVRAKPCKPAFHCAFLRNDQSFDAVYFGLYTDIRLITRSFQLLVSGVKSGPHPTHRPASYSAGAASSAFSVSVSLNLEQTLHLSSSVSCSHFSICPGSGYFNPYGVCAR